MSKRPRTPAWHAIRVQHLIDAGQLGKAAHYLAHLSIERADRAALLLAGEAVHQLIGEARALRHASKAPAKAAARRTKNAARRARFEGEIRELCLDLKAAAASTYQVASLDRFLSPADREAVRDLRESMISTGEVMEILRVSRYRVDKLDREGVLPHVRKRSIHVHGKSVQARLWFPDDVCAFAASQEVAPAASVHL
jgi:hypothetical protein